MASFHAICELGDIDNGSTVIVALTTSNRKRCRKDIEALRLVTDLNCGSSGAWGTMCCFYLRDVVSRLNLALHRIGRHLP